MLIIPDSYFFPEDFNHQNSLNIQNRVFFFLEGGGFKVAEGALEHQGRRIGRRFKRRGSYLEAALHLAWYRGPLLPGRDGRAPPAGVREDA
jgi:hypothetical protein